MRRGDGELVESTGVVAGQWGCGFVRGRIDTAAEKERDGEKDGYHGPHSSTMTYTDIDGNPPRRRARFFSLD